MKKINENKNDQKRNATINKIFEEMEYAKEYLKQWNASYQEKYSDIYSIDLYYTDMQSIQEIEKLYHDQYYLKDVHSRYNRPVSSLKRVTLTDNAGEIYSCEFGTVEWHSESNNKTTRHFIFKNNGDITYSKESSKQKTTKLEYHAQYNVNSNDLRISFTFDKDKVHSEFYDYVIILTSNELSIEINILTGLRKINFKKELPNQQTAVYEIILDQESKIISKSVTVKNYNHENKIVSTYIFNFEKDHLIEATYISEENQEFNMLHDKELQPLAINISSNFNPVDSILNLNAKELEKIIDTVKEQVNNLIKTIKGDIPLQGLSQRLGIALSKINHKINIDQENKQTKSNKAENKKILKKDNKRKK